MTTPMTGAYTALVTPYDADGKINPQALGRLIDKNLSEGVSGFYLGGSTGESYLLSMAEREYLMDAAFEAVDGRAPVIVNVGVIAQEHSARLAHYAAEKGAAALSAVPPFYFSFTADEYVNYYHELAEETEVPVLIYNIPAMSGVKFTTEDLFRLLDHNKVIGMKHTSYDLFQLQRVVQRFPEKNLFIGHDEIYLSALAIGIKAGIGTTYNFMADKYVAMSRLYEEKKMDEALKIQGEVNEVVAALIKVGVFKGTKAILNKQGIDCGVCRKPFLPLTDDQLAYLHQVCDKNGVF